MLIDVQNHMNMRADAGTSHQVVGGLLPGMRQVELNGVSVTKRHAWLLVTLENGFNAWVAGWDYKRRYIHIRDTLVYGDFEAVMPDQLFWVNTKSPAELAPGLNEVLIYVKGVRVPWSKEKGFDTVRSGSLGWIQFNQHEPTPVTRYWNIRETIDKPYRLQVAVMNRLEKTLDPGAPKNLATYHPQSIWDVDPDSEKFLREVIQK